MYLAGPFYSFAAPTLRRERQYSNVEVPEPEVANTKGQCRWCLWAALLILVITLASMCAIYWSSSKAVNIPNSKAASASQTPKGISQRKLLVVPVFGAWTLQSTGYLILQAASDSVEVSSFPPPPQDALGRGSDQNGNAKCLFAVVSSEGYDLWGWMGEEWLLRPVMTSDEWRLLLWHNGGKTRGLHTVWFPRLVQ